jgi:CBS domain-containing protein
LIDDPNDTTTRQLRGETNFKEATMTVRAILDTKGHHILSVEPEAMLSAAVNGKFRHLPVLEGDRVVGLISIGDIVKWRVQEYENEQEALQQYIKTA